MRTILDLTAEDLIAELAAIGEKPYRARQIGEWLHQRCAGSYEDMTNLGKPLRQKLEARLPLRALEEEEHLVSADKLTEKWLFRARAENSGVERSAPAHVETVLIREISGARRTVCVSCMSGCPVGCAFCATGQCGFERNLGAGEILEQIYLAQRRCLAADGQGLSNIVFMGMGEPLLNYDNVLRAARTVSNPAGINLGGRHITISTVGVPSGIRRLLEDGVNFRLALSLHAPEQALREQLIPAAKKWPLSELMPVLREFAASASRQVTIEYCLIHQLNDRKAQARQLADLLCGLPCKINLIPLNPTEGFAYSPPPPDRVRAFQSTLESHGFGTTLREEKGRDINAACGQLRSRARSGAGAADTEKAQ